MRVAAMLVALGIGVTALGGAPAAHAADPTWTVSAGDARAGRIVSFTGASPAFNIGENAGQPNPFIKCGATTMALNSRVGTLLPRNHLFKIPAIQSTFTDCRMVWYLDHEHPTFYPVTVTGVGTWTLNGTNAILGPVTALAMAHVTIHVTLDPSQDCSFDVHGAPLMAYSNQTHVLQSSGYRIHMFVENVAGCADFVHLDRVTRQTVEDVALTITATNGAHLDPLTITSP